MYILLLAHKYPASTVNMHENSLYLAFLLRHKDAARDVPPFLPGRNLEILSFVKSDWFWQRCFAFLTQLGVICCTNLQKLLAANSEFEGNSSFLYLVPSRTFLRDADYCIIQSFLGLAHGLRL